MRLRYVTNSDWCLALLHGFMTGDFDALLEQKRAVEARGFSFVQRIYFDLAHSVDAPLPVYWRGHPWLDDKDARKGFTPRWVLDKCKELDILALVVTSSFHPGTMEEGYNAERHPIPVATRANFQKFFLRYWGSIIVGFEEENEPYEGGDPWSKAEYETMVRQVEHLVPSCVHYASHFRAPNIYSSVHLPIGPYPHEFPQLRGMDALTENWLRAGVPGVRYGELIKTYKDNKVLIGINFGAPFIPQRGLRWGRSWYATTFCMNDNGWTTAGGAVMAELGEPVVEQPPTDPAPDTDEWTNLTRGQREQLVRMALRMDDKLSDELALLVTMIKAGEPVEVIDLRPLRRQVDREVERLCTWAGVSMGDTE